MTAPGIRAAPTVGGMVSLALWVVLAVYSALVAHDFYRLIDRWVYLSVDDGLANEAYTLVSPGRYGFLASPEISGLPRHHGEVSYGPWSFYLAAALIWLFGYSLTLVRSIHLWVILSTVVTASAWFRGSGRAAAATTFGLTILYAYLADQWPMARPDSLVSLFAVALFIVCAGLGLTRGGARATGLAPAWPRCGAFAQDLPLRDVALHTQLLARRHGALDPESSALAAAAADGARRMLLLVQELRTFVEAGQMSPSGAVTADGNAALDRALAELHGPIAESQAGIDRGPLPVVGMREADLAEVFRRLLDNAIKFRQPDRAPRIEIEATEADGHWVLSVGDAGIGIDPGDHAQIFELFQRLNRRETYDGMGMGLPVCRRLVEAYGGRVWVESRAGEGARFFVSIPGVSASAPS